MICFLCPKKIESHRKFCSRKCFNRSLKNRVFTKAWREKIRKSKLGKKNAMYGVVNERHPNWKGDRVSYDGLHKWIYRKLGKPDTCQNCGKSKLTRNKIHWANVSGKYKRDFDDWVRLCVSCHMKFDMTNARIKKNVKNLKYFQIKHSLTKSK